MIANAKSCSVAPPRMKRADDREQRDERRRQRSTGSTPRDETLTIVANDARAHERHVLADAVEDDDRVVDRVAEDGQDRRDRRGGHLAARDRVDAERDRDVVQHRRITGTANAPSEADRHVERDDQHRDDDREERRSAIWRLKLDETFVVPSCDRVDVLRRVASSACPARARLQLLQPDLEALVGLGARRRSRGPGRRRRRADRRGLRRARARSRSASPCGT